MWQTKKIAVIVPAYREERLIGATLRGIPDFVDAIYVIDDASDDGTSRAALDAGDARVRVCRHAVNAGVGAAIVSGYRLALADDADVLVVMAGDNQMAPEDLPALLDPIAAGTSDYVKGNRFIHVERRRMPLLRRLGGLALSSLTRITTGLSVHDTQCGYTALAANAARKLPLEELWPRFGYPNDLLGMLAEAHLEVSEVAVRPIYASERSGVRPWHVLTIAWLVLRRRVRRHLSRSLARRSSERDMSAGRAVHVAGHGEPRVEPTPHQAVLDHGCLVLEGPHRSEQIRAVELGQ
jgi:glycosyltransferase involved in cell wall biosynthesis